MPVLPSQLVFAALSDIGRVRRSNQDSAALSPELGAFVVCDGMGGAAGGEIASQLAAAAFLQHLEVTAEASPQAGDPNARLIAAALAANQAVYQRSLNDPALTGMGTTLVALLHVLPPARDRRRLPRTPRPRFLTPPDLFLLNVGDSRCYRRRAGHLLQLSSDHSFVQEQVRAGQITSEQATTSPMRNYITRAIGPSPGVEPDVESHRTRPGDLLLLCTDGLTRELRLESIADVLNRTLPSGVPTTADLDRTSQALIDAANREGGHDNVTVLLVAFP